ncbi:hypothetical protein EXIGLDRAFT_149082 [Exidia glandulosa HHB12029]|uniref:Uncharacterized protein n=1 Tax=Exidia glandulosa HHB12029 TaxID=1314781 RepID=A0A165FN39_EXIGL|nr:hypothetical protein EXIGLDRAFT_149082 [Exidia glandulosa HHB12029]
MHKQGQVSRQRGRSRYRNPARHVAIAIAYCFVPSICGTESSRPPGDEAARRDGNVEWPFTVSVARIIISAQAFTSRSCGAGKCCKPYGRLRESRVSATFRAGNTQHCDSNGNPTGCERCSKRRRCRRRAGPPLHFRTCTAPAMSRSKFGRPFSVRRRAASARQRQRYALIEGVVDHCRTASTVVGGGGGGGQKPFSTGREFGIGSYIGRVPSAFGVGRAWGGRGRAGRAQVAAEA